jgi:superfamily II DNA helicase RecQ
MDIKILRADKVSDFILSIKERHDNDIKKSGNSSIEFLKTVIETPLETKFRIDELIGTLNLNHVDALKNLRIELSKKYKLLPLYNVFNNEMLSQIIIQKPISIDTLSQIKGFGTKKIELFGAQIIDFVNNNLINSNKTNNDSDEKLMELLLIERVKIAKFNKISENDVFDDKVANRIAKMKPQNKETLSKVYGFKKENINIFGDYLIRVITKYLESINK